MTALRSCIRFGFPVVGVFLIAGSAGAIPLPDTASPCATTVCFAITNTNTIGVAIMGVTTSTSTASKGLIGQANTGIGVEGKSASSSGVNGISGSDVGVSGYSTSSNGVLGSTASLTAAAISALAPNSSGLAYWGTGGIIITGGLAQKAGTSTWSNPSDARIKKDVKTLRWGLEELKGVRPVTFKYNGLGGTDDDGHEYAGVIAQELERIFPTMVTSRKGKLHKEDSQDTDIKVVDPGAFTYVLINAVKEQQQLIEQQQQLIERQDTRIAAIERTRAPIAASFLNGGGVGTGLAIGMLPLAFVAFRRRKRPDVLDR